MKTYRVTLTEQVTYQATVKAHDEKHAREKALEAHEDGVDVEIDNGPVEVDAMEELRQR